MEQELLLSINNLLETLVNKPDATIIASLITVIGMILVTSITSIIQMKTTKRIISSEIEKNKLQHKKDFQIRKYDNWLTNFHDTCAELLIALDPEFNYGQNDKNTIKLIHKTQILLDLNNPLHQEINHLITELSLAITKKTNYHDEESLYRIHGNLLESIRKVISIP